MQSKHDNEEPIKVHPKVDKEDPNRENDLTDIAEPKDPWSNNDNDDPNLAKPKTLKELPSLAKLRDEIELPR
jgi:hypothetical protein